MIEPKGDVPESPPEAGQPITIADILKAVFMPANEAPSALTLGFPDIQGAVGEVFAAENSPDLDYLNEPTSIVYERGGIRSSTGATTRSVLVVSLGVVAPLILVYFAQSALTTRQDGSTARLLYGLATVIWLGLLAFEIAPPDGGLLRRGPTVAGGGPARSVTGSALWGVSSTRGALALSALALSAGTYVFTANNLFSLQGVICWIASVVAWALVAAESLPERVVLDAFEKLRSIQLPRLPSLTSRQWAAATAFIVILGTASFFRYYQINSIPGEMTSDHVEKLLDAYDVSQGQFHVFFPRNGGREAIQMYLVALASSLFGTGMSHLTLKLVSASESVLLVPLIIVLGHELVDWETGFLAAALLAISWWDTSLGRLGLRIVLTPLLFTLVLVCLIRGVRTGSRRSWVWAGIWMGVGVYAYQAMRMAPLVAAAAWLISIGAPLVRALNAEFKRTPDALTHRLIAANILARQTTNFASAGLIAIAIFVPMLRFWHDDPADLWNRVVNRTTSNEVAIQGSPTQVLADNYVRALAMFNVKGDGAWISALPGAPTLDIVTAGLLILGVASWLVRWRIRRDPVDSFVVVAGLIMLLPSALAIAFPIENPSVTRASGVLPVAMILAAWPLALIRQHWSAVMGRRVGIALSGALLSVILAASTLFNYQTYFVGFNQSYRLSALNPGEVAAAVRQIIGPYTTLDGVWLVGWPYWHDYRAIGIDAGDITFENAILDYNVLKDSLDKFPELYARRPLVFIVHQQDEQSKEILKQHFPDGVLKHYLGLSEKHNFFLFVVPAPQ